MNTIAKVRAAHQNPAATIDDLTAAAAGARQIAESTEKDVASLTSTRPDLLLTASDKDLARLDDAVTSGKRTAEVARALATACEVRAAEMQAVAAELQRAKRYDAAVALAAALPAAVEAEYRDLVRIGRSIIEHTARARAAVVAVNADLPEGRSALADPESFRNVPGQPRRVVSARRVKLYVESNTQIIEDQSRVQPRWSVDAQGRPQADKSVKQNYPADFGFNGQYQTDSYGKRVKGDATEVLVRRLDFIEFESVDAVPGRNVLPLAVELKIPALSASEEPAWNFDGRSRPDSVLHELARPRERISPAKPGAPVFNRTLLDRFEQEWGPLSKLGVAVEDGTAEACKRQSDDRHGGYKPFRSTREVTGHLDPSGPARTYLDR